MKIFSKEQLKQLLEVVFEFLKVQISEIHIRLQVWTLASSQAQIFYLSQRYTPQKVFLTIVAGDFLSSF